jgi:hypothetical protein
VHEGWGWGVSYVTLDLVFKPPPPLVARHRDPNGLSDPYAYVTLLPTDELKLAKKVRASEQSAGRGAGGGG